MRLAFVPAPDRERPLLRVPLRGRVVQADPIKRTLKSLGSRHLKLKYDICFQFCFKLAFKFKLRRFNVGPPAAPVAMTYDATTKTCKCPTAGAYTRSR